MDIRYLLTCERSSVIIQVVHYIDMVCFSTPEKQPPSPPTPDEKQSPSPLSPDSPERPPPTTSDSLLPPKRKRLKLDKFSGKLVTFT